jgi:hypothetical protein
VCGIIISTKSRSGLPVNAGTIAVIIASLAAVSAASCGAPAPGAGCAMPDGGMLPMTGMP